MQQQLEGLVIFHLVLSKGVIIVFTMSFSLENDSNTKQTLADLQLYYI